MIDPDWDEDTHPDAHLSLTKAIVACAFPGLVIIVTLATLLAHGLGWAG